MRSRAHRWSRRWRPLHRRVLSVLRDHGIVGQRRRNTDPQADDGHTRDDANVSIPGQREADEAQAKSGDDETESDSATSS